MIMLYIYLYILYIRIILYIYFYIQYNEDYHSEEYKHSTLLDYNSIICKIRQLPLLQLLLQLHYYNYTINKSNV